MAGRDSTENKTTTAKAGKPIEGVEAYVFDGSLDEDTATDRFVEKVNAGNFTFNEAEVRGLASALGVEDEVSDAFVSFEGGPDNPLAGLTPATGSGGTPYEADAATDDTKKAAKEAEKEVAKATDKTDLTAPQIAQRRALAASVKEEK